MVDDCRSLKFYPLNPIASDKLQSPNMSSPIYLKKNNLKNISGNDNNIINNSNNVTDSNIVAFSIGNGSSNNSSQTPSDIIDGTTNVAVNEKDSALSCDLPDPVWNKMNASNSGTKKRKKQDTKPQSQINKCLNEKRRREQENIFIEELAELISVSFSDMNSLSVKPDKCAILQETVYQIRNIKQQQQQQDNQQHHQTNQSNQGAVSTDDIQQGEVSSSKPTVLSNDVFGPLLLEALEGFAFLLDHEAKVDYVTDNVSNFIQFSKDELIGCSIYSIIHPKDHGRFSSCLLPTAVGNWNQNGSDVVTNPQSKNRSSFSCRLLVKNPADDADKCITEDRGPIYENVQISYTLLRGDGLNSSSGNNDISSECTDMSPGLICVARRIPSTEKHLSTPMEQFTTKLDTNGRIVGIDTSGSSATYSNYLNKELMGTLIQDFCHPQDLPKLNSHLKETLTLKQGASPIFRFKVSADKFVHVKTKSRLFNSQDSDFIMATHSIIDDNDVCQIESLPHLQLLNPTSGSYSGGLMLNASNSRHSNVTKLESSSTALTFNNNCDYQPYPLSSSDLSVCDNEFFHNSSPYDMDLERSGWHNRSESGHSLTSTASPSNQHCQGSPASNPPSTPYAPVPFSPIDGERKEGNSGGGSTNCVNVATPETMMSDPVNEIDSSQRLRNLLTTNKKSSVDEDTNRHCSIDSLSNHDENMDTTDDTNLNSGPKKVMALASESSSNRMLLKLLNNKRPEIEEPEKHELLQRILQDGDYKHPILMDQQNEEKILRSIGFSNPSPPLDDMSRLRKRPSEDTGDANVPLKKIPAVLDSIPSPPQPAVILSRSNLQEKNKMLAQLLEKQPTTPTVIPHLPPSIIGATPQDRLPKFSVSSTRSSQDLPINPSSNQLRVTHPQRQTVALTSNVLHELLQQQSSLPPQTGQTPQQLLQRHHNNNLWDTNSSMYYESQENDPALNDLLDQLFATVPPDAVISATDLIDALQAPEGFSNTAEISVGVSNVTLDNPPENNDQDEKAAINAITRSFMQCEQSTNIKQMQRLPQQIVLQQHLPHQTQQPLSQFQSPSLVQPTLGQITQQPFQTTIYPQRGPTGILVHQNLTGPVPARSMTPQYVVPSTSPQFTVSYRPNMMNNNKLLQEHQKRLLRQQHQQMVISSNNASVNNPNSSNLQSMDLLNSAVCPPNVALQRSSSISSDAHSAQQPSPGGNSAFGSAILSLPQISPLQRQQSTSLPSPYSPLGHQQQTFAPLNNVSGVISHSSPTPPQGSRLSPNLSPFQTQLSPRVSQPQQQQSYSGNTMIPSQGAQTAPPQQNAWPTQQRTTPQQQQTQQQIISSRLNLQQLQNPLLDARLSSTGYPSNFAQHQEKSQIQSSQLTQIRSLVSPSIRQSSFPSDVLPSTAANYAISSQPQQHYRLPRSIGLPSSSTIPASQIPTANNNPNGNNTGSEFVRQELRAKVDARMRPPTTMSMEGGQPVDLKSLGLNLEMPVDEDVSKWDMTDKISTAGLSVRTSLSTLGNVMRTNVAANPTLTSISSAGSGEKSSLLQKLLSE